MKIRTFLFAMGVSAIASNSVFATQLTDVVAGTSYSETINRFDDPTVERGVISLSRKWKGTTPKDFIKLSVCGFKNQALDPEGKNSVKVATVNDAAWNAAMRNIEMAVWDWSKIEGTRSGALRISRIRFSLIGEDGKYRECNALKDESDIQVMFNSSRVFRSLVGTDSRKVSAGMWSMTLGIGNNGAISRYHVLHEFGHALGLIHEMGHPKWASCAAEIDYEKLWNSGIRFGIKLSPKESKGLTKKQAEELVKSKTISLMKSNYEDAAKGYGKLHANKTWDPDSIMGYPTAAWVLNTKKSCAFPSSPNNLSKGDEELILDEYGIPL